MALIGTDGQFVRLEDAACTASDQLLLFPSISQLIVDALFPATGVTSGSGELNVIVDGAIVGPETIPANNVAFTAIKQANMSR